MMRNQICYSTILLVCAVISVYGESPLSAAEGPFCVRGSGYAHDASTQPAWKRAIDKVLRKKCPTLYRPQGLPPYSGFYGFHSTYWMRPFCAEELVEPIAPQPIPTPDAIPSVPPEAPMKSKVPAAPPQPSGPVKSKSDNYNPVPKASSMN